MFSPFVHEIISEWKKEAGITHIMLYHLRNNELTIFTDRPGPLIGRGGQLVYKYEEKLKSLPFNKVKSVKIQETTGIV